MKGFPFAATKFVPVAAILVVALLCTVLTATAISQSHPAAAAKSSGANAHKLIGVTATGSTRYTDKEILAASGLELGQNVAEDDFKEATQRLGNSGFFTEVVYSFSYSDAGTRLQFHLADSDKIKLVPVHFENFVWFSESELRADIERRVPLFKDQVPVGGRMADEISKALQALLDEHHLPGHVDFLREGSQEGGDFKGIAYRVEEVSIRIHSVEFPGASAEQAAFLAYGARKLVDADYSRSALAAIARFDLLPLFLERGYLKAAFGPADARVVSAPSAQADAQPQDEITVDAQIPVTPGKQYSVSGITWKGNSAINTAEASSLTHLPAGQPANAVRLLEDMDTLTRLYRSRGYMTIQIKPDAQTDDDKSTVAYTINVAEGDLYRMGELEFVGVDTSSRDRLNAAWKLREGQPYNPDYTRKFLADAPLLLPKGFRYSTMDSEDLDAKEKTVDVTIHFKAE